MPSPRLGLRLGQMLVSVAQRDARSMPNACVEHRCIESWINQRKTGAMIPDAQLHAEVGRLLGILYAKRFAALDKLSLGRLLSKNPYLYRALALQTLWSSPTTAHDRFLCPARMKPFLVTTSSAAGHFAATHGTASDGELRNVTVGAGAGQDIAIETANSYLAISVKSSKTSSTPKARRGKGANFNPASPAKS